MYEKYEHQKLFALKHLPLTNTSTEQYFASILPLVLILYLTSCLPTGRALRSPPPTTETWRSGASDIPGVSLAVTSAVAFPGSVLIVNDDGQ